MRDLLILLSIAGLAGIALFRPWIGVLAWCWVGYMNPHRMSWSFAYDLPVAMMVGVPTLVGLLFTRDKKMPPATPEIVILALLTLHFTWTTVDSLVPAEAWAHWDRVMKVLLMTFITTMAIYGRDRIRALLLVVSLSLGFFAVKGILFTIATGGEHRIWGPPKSFVAGNNDLGIALVMVTPLLFALAHNETRTWLKRVLQGTGLACLPAAIFTYSRGALLGVLCILGPLWWLSRRRVLALLIAIPLGIGWIAFAPDKLFTRASTIKTFNEDQSAMQRLQAWSVAWNIALEHPITGGGFNIAALPDAVWMSYANREYDQWGDIARAAHSVYFQVLGDHGFVGLLLFLLLVTATYVSLERTRRRWRSSAENRWMADYALAIEIGLFGFLISGAFLSQAYFDLFYTYVAVAAILLRESRQVAASMAVARQQNGASHMPLSGTQPRPEATAVAGARNNSVGRSAGFMDR